MDKIIKEVFETDQYCYEKIEALKEHQAHTDRYIKDEKKKIEESMQQDYLHQLHHLQDECKDKINEFKENENEKYLKKLNQQLNFYKTNKENWKQSIYERCLK